MAGVSITLTADGSDAVSVFNSVAKKAEGLADRIRTGFQQRIGQRLFDGLVQAASALPTAIKAAADAGGELADAMSKTGAGGENLVVFRKALELGGVAGEQTTRLLAKMNQAIAGINEDGKNTAEVFTALGLSQAKLRDMDAVDAFIQISRGLAAIESPADRAAMAMRLFGRSGADMLVFANDAGAMDNARKMLGSLPAMLAENASQLDAVSDRIEILGSQWQQIGVAAAASLLPALDSITAKISAMDLSAIGSAIGSILSTLAEYSSTLQIIGAALVALKLTDFVRNTWAKVAAWIAETRAIQANTAALNQNAAAGAKTTSKRGGGMKSAAIAGGVLAVAGIGAQLVMNHADKLTASNDAMAASFDRGNAAAKKFDVTAMRMEATNKKELAALVGGIRDEKNAVLEAAEKQMADLSPADAQKVQSDTETTIRLLDIKARQLEKTSDEQLAANAATRKASAAEAAHAKSIEESIEAYKKARKEYDDAIVKSKETAKGGGALAEQSAELDRVEAVLRQSMGGKISTKGRLSSSEMLPLVEQMPDGEDKAKKMEQLNKLVALEEKRNDLISQGKKAEAEAAEKRATALAAYDAELALLNAQAAGQRGKVQQLQREAEIRQEIAKYIDAGANPKDSTLRPAAEKIVDSRRNAKRGELEEGARGTVLDAIASTKGEAAMRERGVGKRAGELVEQGADPQRARAIAETEADAEKLKGISSKRDGLKFESTLGDVSSMRKIGGGGGATSSGLDYQRQQVELTRQQNALMAQILARTPLPSLE
ncbi:MAG: hypothetical protein V4733_03795 [Verrucomicrobiota bacterium]